MRTLENIPIELIDANPFRDLASYPYIERKIATLRRSIADVGLWEGIIGRRVDDRVQLAFGHHRFEAARLEGLSEIAVILHDLTEEDMLKFMGRENMEDYRAEFLTMLETWEAAVKWVNSPPARAVNQQPIEIARLLGWTREDINSSGDRMNHTANACAAGAAVLHHSGINLTREDFVDLSVHQAQELCSRAQKRMERLDRMGREGKHPAKDIAAAKRHIAKAVKHTAEKSRKGEVAQKDLRAEVDIRAYRHAKEAKKRSPVFEIFGKALADNISKMLDKDTAAEKLTNIAEVVAGEPLCNDDQQVVNRVDFELEALGTRSSTWRKRITPANMKVVNLTVVGEG